MLKLFVSEQGKFTTTICRKVTVTGVYSNFDNLLSSFCKCGMIYTLVYRCFRICSDWK